MFVALSLHAEVLYAQEIEDSIDDASNQITCAAGFSEKNGECVRTVVRKKSDVSFVEDAEIDGKTLKPFLDEITLPARSIFKCDLSALSSDEMEDCLGLLPIQTDAEKVLCVTPAEGKNGPIDPHQGLSGSAWSRDSGNLPFSFFFSSPQMPSRHYSEGFSTLGGSAPKELEKLQSNFTIGMEGQMIALQAEDEGEWQVGASMDDGLQFAVIDKNGTETLLINQTGNANDSLNCANATIRLKADEPLSIRMKYFQHPGPGIGLGLFWRKIGPNRSLKGSACDRSNGLTLRRDGALLTEKNIEGFEHWREWAVNGSAAQKQGWSVVPDRVFRLNKGANGGINPCLQSSTLKKGSSGTPLLPGKYNNHDIDQLLVRLELLKESMRKEEEILRNQQKTVCEDCSSKQVETTKPSGDLEVIARTVIDPKVEPKPAIESAVSENVSHENTSRELIDTFERVFKPELIAEREKKRAEEQRLAALTIEDSQKKATRDREERIKKARNGAEGLLRFAGGLEG